jgi:hypothetical protein
VYRCRKKLIDAIYKYNCEKITQGNYADTISYEELVPYDDVFKRFWDWKIEHMVSPEVFELIKPYLEA